MPEDVSPGADWIALIGVKDEGTRKPLVESLKLYNQLLKYLPSSKVQYYREGTLSFADRKKLLNRARLLVSTHENLLADMVFMPPGKPSALIDSRICRGRRVLFSRPCQTACGHEIRDLFSRLVVYHPLLQAWVKQYIQTVVCRWCFGAVLILFQVEPSLS